MDTKRYSALVVMTGTTAIGVGLLLAGKPLPTTHFLLPPGSASAMRPSGAQATGEDYLMSAYDNEDLAMLTDPVLMGRVAAAEEAYARASAGEDVNWGPVIRDHIVG